jgi:hypothetical protein
VIAVHRDYLEHEHTREWLAEHLTPLRARIRELLEQCARGRHQRTANFASGLLEEYDALWTFVDVPQAAIDPTNNTAERAMRHPVLMRRLQGGTQSDRGNRWIERIQSVRETCRLQDRRFSTGRSTPPPPRTTASPSPRSRLPESPRSPTHGRDTP